MDTPQPEAAQVIPSSALISANNTSGSRKERFRMNARDRAVVFGLLLFWTVFVTCSPALAQMPSSDPFLRGVPTTAATSAPLRISLADAIARGLESNLGGVIEAQRVREAEATRTRALSETLPRLSGSLRESAQIVNLAAFGFTGFPGIPPVIGPFAVFDARVGVSTPLVDINAVNTLRAGNASLRAEQSAYRSTREEVVLAVANLYLVAIADSSRVEASRSQVSTAETLSRLAEDQRASGLVAGIEVLRQQVQLAAARQRLIAAETAADKDKLVLARAIGIPAGQSIELTDTMPFSAAPPLTLDQAVEQALVDREDLRSAEARVQAATAERRAAVGTALPSLHLDADYGALGSSVSTARNTYTVAAMVHMPLFDGGASRSRVEQADAVLRQREAELADLKSGVRYQIAAALLDIKAAEAGVEVARGAEALARQQVEQAQDRFRAGVANSIELAQAQDALASASDRLIATVYTHNVAKAALARSLGIAEKRFGEFVGGQR
jgi:outer membrane protein TolC